MQPDTNVFIRATAGFMYQGKAIEPETELSVPKSFAREVVGSNKAVRIEALSKKDEPAPDAKPSKK